jgi:hypothetical protein
MMGLIFAMAIKTVPPEMILVTFFTVHMILNVKSIRDIPTCNRL